MTQRAKVLAITLGLFLLAGTRATAEPIKQAVPYATTPLPLSDVRVTGGPLKHAQDLDAEYLLKLEPDRMLYGLRQQAGLKPKADRSYGGWDNTRGKQLTGHIAGHYLSAVSYMFAATGDPRFKERADYIVSELKECQEKQGDGYLGALTDNQGKSGKELLHDVGDGKIRAASFDLNGLWSPWYTEHKIFAGLRDAYHLTGNKSALEVEGKFAGWVDSILSKLNDQQVQQMLNTEFGGMNEVLLDLYADTGDEKYLKTSKYFLHHRVIDPLSKQNDILGGPPSLHGNTQVPKLLGELMRYIYTGDQTSGDAAKFFWDQVADHHSFATGGHGYDEYFGPADKMSTQIDGGGQRSGDLRTAESCNVYNMLKMTRVMFSLKPDPKYAEFHERALFNHILASIDPQDGRVCYMVPVGPGVTHEYQDPMGSFTCCVGTGMESHALHGAGIYFEGPNQLWVNLFVPSTADWKAAGAKLAMETSFPEGDDATLKVTTESPKELTISVRRPAWAGEGFAIAVNGQAVSNLPSPASYVDIKRTWKTGDTITMKLPKTLHVEPLPDNPKRVAMMWGPLVLASDLGPESRRGRRRSTTQGSTPPAPSPTTAAAVAQGAMPPAPSPTTAAAGTGRNRGNAQPTTLPTLAVADQPIDQWLKPVDGKPGEFKAQLADYPGATEFVPFYRLHRRTYSTYFDLAPAH